MDHCSRQISHGTYLSSWTPCPTLGLLYWLKYSSKSSIGALYKCSSKQYAVQKPPVCSTQKEIRADVEPTESRLTAATAGDGDC